MNLETVLLSQPDYDQLFIIIKSYLLSLDYGKFIIHKGYIYNTCLKYNKKLAHNVMNIVI